MVEKVRRRRRTLRRRRRCRSGGWLGPWSGLGTRSRLGTRSGLGTRSRLGTRSGRDTRGGVRELRRDFVNRRRELPSFLLQADSVDWQSRGDCDARPVDPQDDSTRVTESGFAPGRFNAGGCADDRAGLLLVLDPSASIQLDRADGRGKGSNGSLLVGHRSVGSCVRSQHAGRIASATRAQRRAARHDDYVLRQPIIRPTLSGRLAATTCESDSAACSRPRFR